MPQSPSRRPLIRKRVYFSMGALAALAPSIIELATRTTTTPELFPATVGVFLMSLLTYPLGALAHLLFLALIGGLPGIDMATATPLAAGLLTSPIYLTLGYLQWYRIVPRIARRDV